MMHHTMHHTMYPVIHHVIHHVMHLLFQPALPLAHLLQLDLAVLRLILLGQLRLADLL